MVMNGTHSSGDDPVHANKDDFYTCKVAGDHAM